MTTTENYLIIFAKTPKAERVKTRLGMSIGMEEAAKIYSQMLERTLAEAEDRFRWQKVVFITPDSEETYFTRRKLNVRQQRGENLGDRLANAFLDIFALDAKRAIAIGSDCPELTHEDIVRAFLTLQNNQAIIGPTNDGGFYLFGVNHRHYQGAINVLQGAIRWSTPQVFREMLVESRKYELLLTLLPIKQDIDSLEDWLDYQQRCGQGT